MSSPLNSKTSNSSKKGLGLESSKAIRTQPAGKGQGDVMLEQRYQGPWKRLAGLTVQPDVPLKHSKRVFQHWQERVPTLIKVDVQKTDLSAQLAYSGAQVVYCGAVVFSV